MGLPGAAMFAMNDENLLERELFCLRRELRDIRKWYPEYKPEIIEEMLSNVLTMCDEQKVNEI
jgi:hypothetical protein